jgi:hypothetical protein
MTNFSNYQYLKATVPGFLETKRSNNGYVFAVAGLSFGFLVLLYHYRKQAQLAQAMKTQNDLLLRQLKDVQLYAASLEADSNEEETTTETAD